MNLTRLRSSQSTGIVNMVSDEEVLRLAERCEKHGMRVTGDAFRGYDDMRHGGETLRSRLREAADAFAIAAALRSRTMRGDKDRD